MIVLHLTMLGSDKPIWVNWDHVIWFRRRDDNGTVLYTPDGDLSVQESPQLILAQIPANGDKP